MSSSREQKKSTRQQDGSSLKSRALRSWRWLWAETANGNRTDSSKATPSIVISRLMPMKVVAWLGASAGGLTILLLVVGFLAVGAHDAMLGIPRSIQTNAEYVAVGGLFFGRSIVFLIASFIAAKSWLVLAILLIVGLVLLKMPRNPSRGKSVLIIFFGAGLLVAEVYGLTRLIRPLQISDLLLNISDANTPSKEIVNALLIKDTTSLAVEYGFLVLLVLAFSVAFILLDQESRDKRVATEEWENRTLSWQLIRVPAFILLVICIFLLPRAYGVLTISNDFPTVTIETSNPSTVNTATQTHLLLREDEKVLVLYEPSSQSVITIKRDSIVQHRMNAPQHVFTASGIKK